MSTIQERYLIENRNIVAVDDDWAPYTAQTIYDVAVKGDNASNYLYFKMAKVIDDNDFTGKTITIDFTNAANYSDFDIGTVIADASLLDPTETSRSDYIYFKWLIDSNVTYLDGIIHFLVSVTSSNFKWQTLTQSATIDAGLILGQSTYSGSPSWLDDWKTEMDTARDSIIQGVIDVLGEETLVTFSPTALTAYTEVQLKNYAETQNLFPITQATSVLVDTLTLAEILPTKISAAVQSMVFANTGVTVPVLSFTPTGSSDNTLNLVGSDSITFEKVDDNTVTIKAADAEISAAIARAFEMGTGTFNGLTGTTITLNTPTDELLGTSTTTAQVAAIITPLRPLVDTSLGDVGEYYVTKGTTDTTSFKVFNTGASGLPFSYTFVRANLPTQSQFSFTAISGTFVTTGASNQFSLISLVGTTLPVDSYQVMITPMTECTGTLGEYYVEKSTDGFKVINTGSSTSTQFNGLLIKGS